VDDAGCFLLVLAEKGIEEFCFANILAELAMLEKDMHRLPDGVIEDLDEFLVEEWVLNWSL
jgi:arginine decarboxylase-like protein